MRHEECIFAAEEDCPKEVIGLNCKACGENKSYVQMKKAIDDFVALGDSFTEIFVFCSKLIQKEDKVSMPIESIQKVNRVMTAFLRENKDSESADKIYTRLIFYFFSIVVDEFEEEEYHNEELVH
jgi:hypothetical protein